MAATFSPAGVIDPTVTYDLEGAARALGRTTRWVNDNLVLTNAIPFRKQGEYKGFPGWVLIQWVEGDLRTHSQWQETDEPTKPSSASKRSS